jgi:hypothetical protein
MAEDTHALAARPLCRKRRARAGADQPPLVLGGAVDDGS